MRLFLCGLCLFAFVFAGEEDKTVPMEFDTYWMVFLNKGPNRDLPAEESMAVQKAHRAHLNKLEQEGKSITAGPFEVPPDYKTRGIVLFPGSHAKEDVVAWALADPAVKAGVLEVEVIKWWTPKGGIIAGAKKQQE